MEEINRTEIMGSGSTLNMTDINNDFFIYLMHLEWSNNVGFKPKLRYYTQFKQDVDAEKYIKVSIKAIHTNYLAKFVEKI